MAKITFEYDSKSEIAKKIIETLLMSGIFKEKNDESPYDPDFVERIRKTEKEPSKKVNLSEYGINI